MIYSVDSPVRLVSVSRSLWLSLLIGSMVFLLRLGRISASLMRAAPTSSPCILIQSQINVGSIHIRYPMLRCHYLAHLHR
ncbi:hypothetical protein F5Y09DRAFT_301264 [Xylaria sp. FL1042]|nr:hypothetical protein F5Y09DRAFT_301264 [Xylaria sp. FL1042]